MSRGTGKAESEVSESSGLYKFLADSAAGDRDFETLKSEQFYAASFTNLNDGWDAPSKFVEPNFVQSLPNATARVRANRLLSDLNDLGVYCLSATKGSAVMWAHYADNWQGLCIEYGNHDRNVFFNELRTVYGIRVFVGALSMVYVDSPMRLEGIHLSAVADKRLLVRKLLSQKAREWAYEQEFRLLFVRAGLYHMPQSMLSGVYLGYQMANAQKKKYMKLLSSRGIPVWEARPASKEFNGLDVKRLC